MDEQDGDTDVVRDEDVIHACDDPDIDMKMTFYKLLETETSVDDIQCVAVLGYN